VVDDVAIIERFVHLVWRRREEALPETDADELQRLADHLGQTIAGAASTGHPGDRAASRVVVGASGRRAAASVSARPAPAPAAPAGPGSSEPAGEASSGSSPPSTPRGRGEAAPSGASVDIPAVQIPDGSSYTPSQRPVFARDYYGEDPSGPESPPRTAAAKAPAPSAAPADRPLGPAAAPPPAGEPPATRTPGSRRHPPPSPADGARAEAASRPRRRGRSALVYRTDGSTVRGSARSWNPDADRLTLDTKTGRLDLDVRDVLVAFLGPEPDRGVVAPADGRRVKVKLTNGKRLVGVTDDYDVERDRFTLLPDAKDSGVDRVWVPVRSVEKITPLD